MPDRSEKPLKRFHNHRRPRAPYRPARHAQHDPRRPAGPERLPPRVADHSPARLPVPAEGAFSLLIPEIQRAVADEGYATPTPIQEQTIPHLLAGRDLLGCAQTGTGKTAAFTLPILQYLARERPRPSPWRPRVLILAPTRELAAQIGDSIAAYGRHLPIRHAVIYGGVGQGRQVSALERGVDILVATPGRLRDLMQQRYVNLASIEVFVLDEVDRMLDMGFIHDVRRIIEALPAKRQSLFLSATMPPEVVALARKLVHDPVHVTISPEQPTVERVLQKVMFVEQKDKDALLAALLHDRSMSRVLVFTGRKHGANKVVKKLLEAGISGCAIHGNKSQSARTQALAGFKSGRVRVLVATDIAARGLDVDAISHVINYDLPNVPETYVHRIGRTARAGAGGDAISFCSPEERGYLRDIERLIRMPVPADTEHAYHSEKARHGAGGGAAPGPRSWQGRAHGRARPGRRQRYGAGRRR